LEQGRGGERAFVRSFVRSGEDKGRHKAFGPTWCQLLTHAPKGSLLEDKKKEWKGFW